MNFGIPAALKAEHEELHSDLVRATKAGGRTAEAAQSVAKVLHPHFVKEEEYALPPLGLLTTLAKGTLEPGMRDVIKLTDKLEADLPQMLAEHKQILTALKTLVEAARAENKIEHARFAERLIAHALTEEQVSYPTALLVGRYLKTVLPNRGPRSNP
jgi:Hemerythrin HHE cation binding domain